MELSEIVDSFEFLDDWEDKYRFVIDLGKSLEAMPEALKTDANLVRGCQSQVWLHVHLHEDGTVLLQLDSDAHIVRGLIAIVLAIYARKPPAEILSINIEDIFARLELVEHLSQTRGNGLRAMVAKIREKTAEQAS